MTRRPGLLGVHDVDLPDWRRLLGALHARYEVGSFAARAAFVAEVAELCDPGDAPARVELDARRVGLMLRDDEAGGVTAREVRLADGISALARAHQLAAVPAQVLELALDTPSRDAVLPFWTAVLDGREADGAVVDPAGALPPLWFQETGSSEPGRQWFHLDVTVPPEVADRRIAAAVAAGGRVVDDSRAPAFVVLADPDGNRVCVCTELGRD
ncbi:MULTISPECIES: VOC family protein [Pseudonocardia]|uniref:VOC family protein n=1 Tax=Pseudonocardia TaxID=1847 RepID=UPI0018D4E91C|nr:MULTISPECIES: VOC family protein [Pseudonocardia]